MLKKILLISKLLILFLTLLHFAGVLERIYDIPVDTPFYRGNWDEPFAVNSGINILRNNGDPVFYNYGGTVTYPHALIFYLYCKDKNIVPYYKQMDEKFKNPAWPLTRRIYPVKPIYIAKVASLILFIIGSFFVSGLFIYLLLPVAFLIIPALISDPRMFFLAKQMLPETQLVVLAGLSVVFFAHALMTPTDQPQRYFHLTLLCTIFSSLAFAAKLNAAYLMLLPVSLMYRMFQEKTLTPTRILKTACAGILPYILVNPAVIFNFSAYMDWLAEMNRFSGTIPGKWTTRVPRIKETLEYFHLYNLLPAILLIGLFVWAVMLMIKKNPAAFAGFMSFLLLTMYTLFNMKHAFYGRHAVFLVIPFLILILFPFIYYYHNAPLRIRTGFTVLCLLLTIWFYPPWDSIQHIHNLSTRVFTTNRQPDTRDDLERFVQSTGATLYFYDHHGFSLPETIFDKIIPFTDIRELPAQLGTNSYLALVKYKKTHTDGKDVVGDYNEQLALIYETYAPVKVFGNPDGAHDITDQGPLRNPAIELLLPKAAAEPQNTQRGDRVVN